MPNKIVDEHTEPDKSNFPEVVTWLNLVNENSLANIINSQTLVESILKSKKLDSPLPIILTFCPAIKNLDKPNDEGQTRSLVPLDSSLPRLKAAIKELLLFMILAKQNLKVDPEVFLVFADSLETGAKSMFTNADEMPEISSKSIQGVRSALFEFDHKNPGLLQESGIRIPKIRKQSQLQGISRDKLIEEKESKILDPLDSAFELWRKHLILTKNDSTFVSTGWQSKKSAETIWNRTRFLLAEFMADGEILPKTMELMSQKRFPDGMPPPIFLASTTREAGIQMEADGFNLSSSTAIIPALHNIGRWTDKVSDSPWIHIPATAIINKHDKD